MDPSSVSLLFAFGAGMVSFVSPCMLPMVPAYLGYIAGSSAQRLAGGGAPRGWLLLRSVQFVLGFTLVFTGLGASASLIGLLLRVYQPLLAKVAGALIVFFGLNLMGIWRWMPLFRGRMLLPWTDRGGEPLSPGAMGAAFAIGWTPCVGLVLGSILALASQSATVGQGALLLAVYALGMGLPFILATAALDRFRGWSDRLARSAARVELATGALLVGLGVLVFTNQFLLVTAWLIRTFGLGLAL